MQQYILDAGGTLPPVIMTSEAERCAWCWKQRHPGGEPFPETWSSSICPECEAAMYARLAVTRAERAARKEAR
jgi:hypothetical protein